MRDLQFDAKTGLLTAGAGCRLADVNNFLLARGRSCPRARAKPSASPLTLAAATAPAVSSPVFASNCRSRIAETLMTRPSSLSEKPSKQWPPDFMAMGSWSAMARCIACMHASLAGAAGDQLGLGEDGGIIGLACRAITHVGWREENDGLRLRGGAGRNGSRDFFARARFAKKAEVAASDVRRKERRVGMACAQRRGKCEKAKAGTAGLASYHPFAPLNFRPHV